MAATTEYKVKLVLDSAEFEAKMAELEARVAALADAVAALREATDGEE
jgi:hypothetical protein